MNFDEFPDDKKYLHLSTRNEEWKDEVIIIQNTETLQVYKLTLMDQGKHDPTFNVTTIPTQRRYVINTYDISIDAWVQVEEGVWTYSHVRGKFPVGLYLTPKYPVKNPYWFYRNLRTSRNQSGCDNIYIKEVV